MLFFYQSEILRTLTLNTYGLYDMGMDVGCKERITLCLHMAPGNKLNRIFYDTFLNRVFIHDTFAYYPKQKRFEKYSFFSFIDVLFFIHQLQIQSCQF